jgi:hypothetical protein
MPVSLFLFSIIRLIRNQPVDGGVSFLPVHPRRGDRPAPEQVTRLGTRLFVPNLGRLADSYTVLALARSSVASCTSTNINTAAAIIR